MCLLIFTRIDQIVATYHFICISDCKIDANALVEWGLLQLKYGWNDYISLEIVEMKYIN
jgi:hypothetical protein